jgi:DNA-binding transcriptional regulator YiaG
MNKTCIRCNRQKVVNITLDDTIDACGHTFTAQLPAEKCESCGDIVIQGEDIRRFELRVAVELAKAGTRSGEAFRLLRKSLSLEPAALAQLLDVSEDFVGYWERSEWPVDPRALAVLRSLVLARHAGQHTTLDCLGVLRQPRALGRKVRVVLGDALAVAAKALQFGSAAWNAPASA